MASEGRVSAELAALRSDAGSAPAVPPEVTARVVSALRAAPPPNAVTGFAGADGIHRKGTHRKRMRWGAVLGLVAAAVAAIVGTTTLLHGQAFDPGLPTAQHITVSMSPPIVPLSPPQIVGLLNRRPDFGALSDEHRRASCLNALGYPSSERVLGVEPVDVDGQTAMLLVLPGDKPDDLSALVVRPTCSSTDNGLIADTRIPRP